jgi:hypothetical protein
MKTAYDPMRACEGYRDIIGSSNRDDDRMALIELVPVRRAHTMHITFGTGQILPVKTRYCLINFLTSPRKSAP